MSSADPSCVCRNARYGVTTPLSRSLPSNSSRFGLQTDMKMGSEDCLCVCVRARRTLPIMLHFTSEVGRSRSVYMISFSFLAKKESFFILLRHCVHGLAPCHILLVHHFQPNAVREDKFVVHPILNPKLKNVPIVRHSDKLWSQVVPLCRSRIERRSFLSQNAVGTRQQQSVAYNI